MTSGKHWEQRQAPACPSLNLLLDGRTRSRMESRVHRKVHARFGGRRRSALFEAFRAYPTKTLAAASVAKRLEPGPKGSPKAWA
jgi:hypothetical protein